MLSISIKKTLFELTDLLSQLSDKDYVTPCKELSDASIGGHTRHIIEMFQCLHNQYPENIVCYDKRIRNLTLETQTKSAIEAILEIIENLNKEDKPLDVQLIIDDNLVVAKSSYGRELLYAFDHCIHHQALIKVAIITQTSAEIDMNFGVARSTIEYRKQCAQ